MGRGEDQGDIVQETEGEPALRDRRYIQGRQADAHRQEQHSL